MIAPTLAQRVLPDTSHLLLRNTLLVAAGTLLMALCARIAIPLPWTPIPITMQTFGVLLIGALYGPRLGALTMAIYLAEAVIGLPVLSFGRSAWSPDQFTGLPLIIGSTAGYLFCYPLAAALTGWLATRGWDRKITFSIPAMLLGNLIILTGGFVWLAAATLLVKGSINVSALLGAAVLPFLPGDAGKLLLAALVLPGAWQWLDRSAK